MAGAQTLVILTKAPRAGRAKTRLATMLGLVGAAVAARRLADRGIARLGRDRRWRTVLAIDPPRGFTPIRVYAAARGLATEPQVRGTLGARMAAALTRRSGRPQGRRPGPVILVGSDILDLTAADIAQAFRMLGRATAVIGPAWDGGFWLFGLSPRAALRPARLFAGVPWSRPDTLAWTLGAVPQAWRIAIAATRRDVDTVADLAAGQSKRAALSPRLPREGR